jgi:predicted Zn-dependent protease
MDKISGLKEILALDPKNSFARYGIAMELANRGEIEAALSEFTTLLGNDPDYTAAYFMSAQTLTSAGRVPEAVERLKAGISCAARSGNSHALSEMQGMLDELDR